MKKQILTLAVGLALGASAFAQEHEVTGGTSGAIGLSRNSGDNYWTGGLGGGYDAAISELIQLGGEVGVSWVKPPKPGVSLQTYSLLVGPTFNFGETLNDAVFVGAKAGVGHVRAAGNGVTALLAQASVGKRFELLSNVSYKPSVEVNLSRSDETNTFSYTLNVLALSVIF